VGDDVEVMTFRRRKMKLSWRELGRVLLILVWVTSVFACAKKTIPSQPGFGPGGGESGSGMGGRGGVGGGLDEARWRELGINSEPEKREFLQKAEKFENTDVYFDYDSYVLSEPAKKILDDKIQFLKRYPAVKVSIEGHCDERGTNEYNLALGERRANSALQYLVNSGLNQQKLGVISYGEERPIATGHDEASMAKNRRDHFTLNY
jgi:peptidoglycan-associated lipoprotein